MLKRFATPAALAFTLSLCFAGPIRLSAQATTPQTTQSEQDQLKKEEQANKEQAKAEKDKRKALKQQDKAAKAAKKAGNPAPAPAPAPQN